MKPSFFQRFIGKLMVFVDLPSIAIDDFDYSEDGAKELLGHLAKCFSVDVPRLKFDGFDDFWASRKVEGNKVSFYMDNYLCDFRFRSREQRDRFYEYLSKNTQVKCKDIHVSTGLWFFENTSSFQRSNLTK